MKRLALVIALFVPVACTTTPTHEIAAIERPAPLNSVRVTVGDKQIPVTNATVPLHYSLDEPRSPARDHIRQLLLNAKI